MKGTSRPAAARRWWSQARPEMRRGWRHTGVFLRILRRRLRRDAIALHAAALAFVTILSLVPLLAAFAFIGQRAFAEYQDQIVGAVGEFLPYSEAMILERLHDFLGQAQRLRGPAVVVFILAALAVFGSIEETINRIWNVSERRSLRVRLLSVTLLLFWGPLVIGASFSTALLLREWSGIEPPAVLVHGLPLAGTLVALTMLYWLVPYTHVGLRYAFAGGATAAVLLELLRQAFSVYVQFLPTIDLIYGGFALLLLFVISIQLCWWIVLLGCEVAFASQHFRYLALNRQEPRPADHAWTSVVALTVIARRFVEGSPTTPQAWLASRLHLPVGQLEDALLPLVEAGVLQRGGGEARHYLLARDPYQLPLEEIFGLYEPAGGGTPTALDEELAGRLEELRVELAEGRSERLARRTLADLVRGTQSSTPSLPGEVGRR